MDRIIRNRRPITTLLYSILIMTEFFVFSDVSQGVTIESVTLDTNSYKGNPWKLFHYEIDASTRSSSECETLTADLDFINLKGKSSITFPQSWQVCGPNSLPERKVLTYDDTATESNYDGIFACGDITAEGNVTLDSYSSESGAYPENSSSRINLYANDRIQIKGKAEIFGNLFAHSIEVAGHGFVTGSQNITGELWNCNRSEIDTIRGIVSAFNYDDLIPDYFFDSPDSLGLCLNQNDILNLAGGVYYFSTMKLTGDSRLETDGNVLIYCEGDVSIEGQSQINADGSTKRLTIVSLTGSIRFSGTSLCVGEFFTPNGSIELNGSSEVFGRVSAADLYFKGYSQFHQDLFQNKLIMSFAKINIYDAQGLIVDVKVVPAVLTAKIQLWKVERNATDGHFHKWNKETGGLWSDQGRLSLRGYSDYEVLFYTRLMWYLVFQNHARNICEQILGWYDLSLGDYRRLTLHRVFTSGPSVQEDPYTFWPEYYDQPWGNGDLIPVIPDYPSGSPAIGMWQYYVGSPSMCDNGAYDPAIASTYYCYWFRFKRLMDDTRAWGAVVELSLFDNSTLKYDQNSGNQGNCDTWNASMGINADPIPGVGTWKENPWNPRNQCASYNPGRNELDWDQSPQTDTICDSKFSPNMLHQSVYEKWGTNYFFLTACPNADYLPKVPKLKVQQQMFVEAFATKGSTYANIIWELNNEPDYRMGIDSESAKWHVMIAGWLKQKYIDMGSEYLPQISINITGHDNYSDYTALQNLVPSITSVLGDAYVAAITYHAGMWLQDYEDHACANFLIANPPSDRFALLPWHRNNSGDDIKHRVCIVDDDGNWQCREDSNQQSVCLDHDHANLRSWAQIIYDYGDGEDFNHKDFLWIYESNGFGFWCRHENAMKIMFDPDTY